jgi:hypothetical protein
MNEAEWNASTDPAAMLAAVRGPYRELATGDAYISDRKLLLWVEACRERVAPGEAFNGNPGLAVSVQDWSRPNGWEKECPLAVRALLLRCVVGNPFRTYAWTDCHRCDYTPGPYQFLDKQWLAWRGGTVPALARHIYDERDWSALPVLADVLEEAGCGDADILGHCRGDGGACRGCYAGATWCEVCGGTGRLPVAHGRGCWCVDLILGLS